MNTITRRASALSVVSLTLILLSGLCIGALRRAAETHLPTSKQLGTAQFIADETLSASLSRTAQTTSIITPTQWLPPEDAYRITVEEDGIYALTYDILEEAGLPVATLDPKQLRMFTTGREMAIQVIGEDDGSFDLQDVIIFYGRSIDSLYFDGLLPDHRYTSTNTYWLSYGNQSGKRMGAKDASISGTPVGPIQKHNHLEKQTRYESKYPRYSGTPRFDAADDHWFWYRLQVFGTGKSQSITLPVENQASGTYSATVQVHIVGGTDNSRGLQLAVNNTDIFEDTTSWHDYEPFTAYAPFSQTLLSGGTNNLQITVFNVEGPVSEVYIDWVKLSYYADPIAISEELIFDGPTDDSSATLPAWSQSVSGFTSDEIQIFDITDLENTAEMLNLAITGSTQYTATFGDTAANHRYIAVTPDAWKSPSSVEAVHYPNSQAAASRSTTSAASIQHNDATAAQNGISVVHGDANLLDPSNAADWIAITHRDFWTATLPLVEHRAKEMRVALVDVQRIYDQFSGGQPSANAIRDFLAYAYQEWTPPAPKYVLLVGGGTSDPRNYLANSKPTYIPPFMYPADPILGETAADNRFVTFVGNDILPDMALGRFPAFSANEVSIIVSKTLHYETTPPFDDWNTNILFISDDLEGGGGNFYEFSDIIADGSADPLDPEDTKFIPEPYEPSKVYLGQTCDTTNPAIATECRQEIADSINNEGALFVSYVGHAQTRNWGAENLMDPTLVGQLSNLDQLPIFLAMTCFEGFFHEPPAGDRSLSEFYIFNPDGGAVASWSPTGFGVATGHDYLEQGFFLSVFQDDETRLGSAMVEGKRYLSENTAPHKYDDLIDTFNLFGDPALVIQTFVGPTAVNLTALTAQTSEDQVLLEWSTLNETGIVGFHLYRSEAMHDGQQQESFSRITPSLLPAKSVATIQGNSYRFVDAREPSSITPRYQLEVIYVDGTTEQLNFVESTVSLQNTQFYLPIAVR